MKPIFPTNQQTNQSTSTLATVLRYPEVLKCLWVPMRCHVCRFFDFSYHPLTALSQLLVSPRLQDLESLLTTLATVPTLPSDISRNFDKPKLLSPYLSVFPTEHLFWSSYFPMHFCHQSSLLQCNLQFSNVVYTASRKATIMLHQSRFYVFPQKHRTIFYPNFQFFDWRPLPVCANIKEYFSTHFRPRVKQNPNSGRFLQTYW